MAHSDTGGEPLFRTGSVVGHTETGVIVDVSLGNACQQCAEGRGCGMGLLARRQQQRITVLPSPSPLSHHAAYPLGSTVTIALPKHQVSHLTLFIYAVPLFLAMLAAGLASLLGGREWLCVMLFFGTLMCSVLTLKYLMRGRMERFRPRLVS